LAQSPCGQDDRLGGEGLQAARCHLQGDHPAADTVLHDQPGNKPLVVALDAELEELLKDHMEEDLARYVGDEAGPGEACAAEGALGYPAVLTPAEGGAHMLQLDDVLGRLLAEDLDGVLVAQVVAPLNGIEGVLLPRVVLPQGGVYPPLGCGRVAPDRIDLGDEGDIHALPLGLKGGPHPRQPATYYKELVCYQGFTPWSIVWCFVFPF